MANICSNEIHITFLNKGISRKKYDKILEEFGEEFSFAYYEFSENNEDELGWSEIHMGTKWSSPDQDELLKFAEKYNLRIIGVSYEFSNGYVNHFEINT